MTVVEDIPTDPSTSTRLIIYPLVLIATLLWVLYRWQTQSKLYKLGNKLPGPSAVPIFGNALLALGKKPDGIYLLTYYHTNIINASIMLLKSCILKNDLTSYLQALANSCNFRSLARLDVKIVSENRTKLFKKKQQLSVKNQGNP